MKLKILATALLTGLLFHSCLNRQTEKQPGISQVIAVDSIAKTETRQLNIDTIFHFNSAGKNYQLMITLDSVETEYGMVDHTTAWLIRDADTLFRKTYEFNNTGEFLQPTEGEYWLALYNSGGGSGYTGQLFHIETSPEAKLTPVMKLNELSYWSIGRNGTSVLSLDGIWNMGNPDDDSFEAHFSPHQQSVALYSLQGDSVSYRGLGTTKGKYDFFEDENGLKSFREKEIAISKQIDWTSYFRSE